MTALAESPTAHPAALFGAEVMRQFDASSLAEQPGLSAWLRQARRWSDLELLREAVHVIRDVSFCARFEGLDVQHLLCRESAVAVESVRRLIAAGHDPACGFGVYRRARSMVVQERGNAVVMSGECTCGRTP